MSKGLDSLKQLEGFKVMKLEEIKHFENIEKDLNDFDKLKSEICEMFGLDNLFPYDDINAIIKGLEEHMEWANENHLNALKNGIKAKCFDILKATNNIKISFYDNGRRHYKIEFDRTRNQEISKENYELLEKGFKK